MQLLDQKWNEWKRLHNKKYLSIEEHDRKKLNWKINEAFIQKHNAEFDRKFHTYKTSHNKYSDLNSKEFKSIKGLNANYNLKNNNSRLSITVDDDLPAEVDWRPLGYVNPIQDQGQCGCCYAFSACGSIEGQLFKKSGTLIKLSEQQILDCSDQYGNGGCNGGTMNNSFTYIQMNGGIETSDSYPYEGQVGDNRYDPSKSATTLSGYVDIPYGEIDALSAAIAQIGPIAVGIDASRQSFQLYSSGVYYDSDCSPNNIDHAVVVVGYGSDGPDNDYFILKNSWGSSWGDSGYMKMAKKNFAGIANMASYPTL